MERVHQVVLIISTLMLSWLGMMVVHEFGHVLGAWMTGGTVTRVVLHPLAISRTDVSPNQQPLFVVWAGPVLGVILPLAGWGLAAWIRLPGSYLLRFFAGFCLIANGAYIGVGEFDRVGDAGELLRHGAAPWDLWLFGIATIPLGLLLWHRQGIFFGLGAVRGKVNVRAAYGCLFVLLVPILVECIFTS
jgi:hypothetical protein